MTDRSLLLSLLGDDSNVADKMKRVRVGFDALRADFDRKALKLNLDDKGTVAKLTAISQRMDRLDRKTARMSVSVDGANRAIVELASIDAALDRVKDKSGLGFIRSRTGKFGGNLLSSLWSLSSIKQLVTGNASSGSGLADVLGSPVGVAGGLGALGLGASIIPAIVGGGVDFGVGGLGLMLAKKFDPKGFKRALSPVKGVLNDIGAATARGFIPILRQVARFIQSLSPELTKLFTAATPGIRQFTLSLEPAIRQALPQLVIFLKTLTKSGLMKDLGIAFGDLLTASVKALNGISVGFKASGHLVVQVARVIGGALELIGRLIGGVARIAYDVVQGKWKSAWIAAGSMGKDFVRIINSQFGNLAHNIASIFDVIRHTVATVWDQTWRDVTSFASRALHALASILLTLGKQALGSLWQGMKAGASPITSWLSGFAHAVVSIFKTVWGWFSPSKVMFNAGRDLMLGLEAGVKAHAHKAQNAVLSVGAHVSGSAQHIAQSLLARFGWANQWAAFNSVEMREAGWNMRARNPSSGAYGLAQFINGPSEYFQWGGNPNTVAGQLVAMMNYIRSRYGSPTAAWAHELRFGWYDKGGKLPPGLSLALNTTGHDEIHTSGSGGDIYNVTINQLDHDYSDAKALRTIKTLRKYKLRHGGAAIGLS